MRLSTTRMCASIVAVALGIVLVASGTRAQTTAGAAAPKPGEWTKPAFCKDLECPRYQVVKKISDNIELRKYEPGSWASTTMAGSDTDRAMSGSFMRLFNYIQGSNAASQKISMTAPVLARVQSGNVTVGFYNPYKYQGPTGSAAPAPTDPSVYIQQLPSLEVYVLSYGGLTSSATQKQKRDELAAALKAAKLPFDSSTWFTAGYDAPYQLLNRHNEVMIPATPVAPAAPATAPGKAVPAAAAKASPVAAAAKAATASPAAKPALTSPVAKPAAAGRKLKL